MSPLYKVSERTSLFAKIGELEMERDWLKKKHKQVYCWLGTAQYLAG